MGIRDFFARLEDVNAPFFPSQPSAGRRFRLFSWRLARWLAVLLLLGYAAVCATLYIRQNELEYPRKATGVDLDAPIAIARAATVGLVPWDQPIPGAASPQGYVLGDFRSPAPRGTVVVFHGNGNWAGQRMTFVEAFRRRGFRTFLYEYPGYGGRPGAPSEKAIVPDARALIRALDQAGLGPIYLCGESLGSGVASAVAGDPALPVHGILLITPWDTVANVGLYRYPYIPVRQLMTDRYDSIAKLEHFAHPICVVRSAHDEIIPPPLTLNLFAHLPAHKKLILQENCGHEDWPSAPELTWWDEALDFIAGKQG